MLTETELQLRDRMFSRLGRSATLGTRFLDGQLKTEWQASARIRRRFNDRFRGFERWARDELRIRFRRAKR